MKTLLTFIKLPNIKINLLYLILASSASSCINDGKVVQNPLPVENRTLTLVASSENQWTGVAVSKEGRIFSNYPNWKPTHSISVVEVTDTANTKPFPDVNWNTWDSTKTASDHFVCVQSVVVDNNNFLWVLDPANPQRNGKFIGVVEGGAKLVKFDLATNQVVQSIFFKAPAISKQSYLNDVRFDEAKQIAYITDSNEGALLVVDLKTGTSRKVLAKDSTTKSDNRPIVAEGIVRRLEDGRLGNMQADGIALSFDKKQLYYRAINTEKFYRIETAALLDSTLSDSLLSKRVEFLGNFPPSDGLMEGPDGSVYLTSIEENGVRKFLNGAAPVIVQNPDLKWPDSFAIGPDSFMYVTASQIHLKNPPQPYKIFKFKY